MFDNGGVLMRPIYTQEFARTNGAGVEFIFLFLVALRAQLVNFVDSKYYIAISSKVSNCLPISSICRCRLLTFLPVAKLIRAATALTRATASLIRDMPREFSVQPDHKVSELLFLAFAKSKAPRKNLWLRLRNHDYLKERPILFKHSLPMWSRLRYEVEDEEEFERRPMYKYHVRQHHLGIFDRLQIMSYKSALPVPGGDVIEERGDDLLTQELNFYSKKRLKRLYNHLDRVELQMAPDYDYNFLLEPLEAGMPDDKYLLEEEDTDDHEDTAMGQGRSEEEDTSFGKVNKDKEGAEQKNFMSIDEAKKILEAKVVGEEGEKETYDMEDLEKKYKLLFSLNDPAAGGSVYLAMKIQTAYDLLRGKLEVGKPKKKSIEAEKDNRRDNMKAEHRAQQHKFNPNLKTVRIPNPFYLPQYWQDMNVEEKKLAEHVLERLKPEIEWRDKMYEEGRRRKPGKRIPEVHQDYY